MFPPEEQNKKVKDAAQDQQEGSCADRRRYFGRQWNYALVAREAYGEV